MYIFFKIVVEKKRWGEAHPNSLSVDIITIFYVESYNEKNQRCDAAGVVVTVEDFFKYFSYHAR